MSTSKKINLINYLIATLPLSLILGNLAINLNIIIICVVGFIFYKKNIFFMKNKSLQFLIYSFFIYLILITAIENIPKIDAGKIYQDNILKSIFFFRFLILFLVLNRLFEDKNFNLKIFFSSCSLFSFALAIDILIQIIFGKDLFGYTITNNRPSGFFGSENIAGGYLQKFSLFFIFFFALKINSSKKNLIIFLMFLFFIFVIFLTGNRMPLIIFFLTFILYLLFEKNKIHIIILLIIVTTTFFLILKFPGANRQFTQFYNLYHSATLITKESSKLFISNTELPQIELGKGGGAQEYLFLFNAAVQNWKKNKFFGKGIKSFRINCEYKANQLCGSHPHNYILEIMIDTGLIGLSLILIFFLKSLVIYFKIYLKNFNQTSKYLSLPFFFIIFFEIFPLRSTGSFFSTNNAVILFMMVAVLINSEKIKGLGKSYKK